MKVKECYKNSKVFIHKLRITLALNIIPEKYYSIIKESHPHVFEEETTIIEDDLSINDTIEGNLFDTSDNN
jgi:hypothetical protein